MDSFVIPAANLFLIFVVLNLVAATYITSKKRKSRPQKTVISPSTPPSKDLEGALFPCPPGPTPLPILGNLHLMAKYEENPYAGFTEMAKEFGPIYKLRLGSTPCVVINGLDNIMEVLIKKGNSFDGRPNFARWNAYFDGDRQQSLALCDWNDVQKTRRNIVRSHLMLKQISHKMDLERWIGSEMIYLLEEIEKKEGEANLAKLPISYCALNIFMGYMCSTRFDYSDKAFTKISECFDLIFQDINNGHPTDFMPWLMPFFNSYKNKINDLAGCIRKFILEKIIKDRPQSFDQNDINDLVDALLSNYVGGEGENNLNLDWQNILFALEDLLGGSSAISNVIMRVLAYVAKNPVIQAKLQQEVDEAVGSYRIPTLEDRSSMLFTEATILETLRHTSSPIVPHVANEDSSVGDYFIEKDTVLFLNNYELNVSSSLWDQPEQFIPERFIVKNQIKKPSYFIPFSTGKRSCIGSRILMNVTFITISTLLQRYTVTIPEGVIAKTPVGKLAIDGDGFPLVFKARP